MGGRELRLGDWSPHTMILGFFVVLGEGRGDGEERQKKLRLAAAARDYEDQAVHSPPNAA